MPPKTRIHAASSLCPCGSQKTYGECCLPFIEGLQAPASAEQLMRSRYSAHVVLAIDYLWDTWSPEQRLRSSPKDIQAWAESCEWMGLQILSTEKGSAADEAGIVEFVAIFRSHGELQQHHERSLFKKVLGKWLYVDHQE